MKPFSINLCKNQFKYYEAVKWLTNPMGQRGSGRTYLMAIAFIEHSLNFNMSVPIYNHDNNFVTQQEMLKRISDIIVDQKGLYLKIENAQGHVPTIYVKRK